MYVRLFWSDFHDLWNFTSVIRIEQAPTLLLLEKRLVYLKRKKNCQRIEKTLLAILLLVPKSNIVTCPRYKWNMFIFLQKEDSEMSPFIKKNLEACSPGDN